MFLPNLRILEQAKDSLCNLKANNHKQCSQELLQALESAAKDLLKSTETNLAELKFKPVYEVVLYARMLMLDPSIPVRIIEGLLVVYTSEANQVEKVAGLCKDVPKVLRPILQPMGQTGFMKEFDDVLPLPAVDVDADWNSVPDPGNPTLQNIKLEREQALTAYFGCKDAGGGEVPDKDVPGQGSVRRLWADPESSLLGLASDKGKLYVTTSGNKLFRWDVSGFTEINGQPRVPAWSDGLAVSGNRIVTCDKGSLWVGEICKSDAGTKLQNEFEKTWELAWECQPRCRGPSMTRSRVYFCCGSSVLCLDLEKQTFSSTSQAMESCYKDKDVKRPWLLGDPQSTALVGNSLFVADAGNGQVLSYDMRKNKCGIIFKGKKPCRLAADHGNLFIYDADQNKIFHVDLGAAKWPVAHVLGTGSRGTTMRSPEGLPPLSTHLGEICDMAVGHDGELVYLEDNSDLRAFKLAPKAVSELGALCAKKVALFQEVSGEESDALVPFPELQPTYGAEWEVFCPKTVPMPMFASEILPLDRKRVSFEFSLASPTHGLGIALVPDVNRRGANAAVDSHLISPPDWVERTYVSTLSVMQGLEKKPFRKIWKAAMASFRNMVTNSEAEQETLLGEPFHFRNQNDIEVVVERSYNKNADCFVWTLVKVLINDEERAGALKSLIAGVDVGVRICIFVAQEGGSLEFLGEPKLV